MKIMEENEELEELEEQEEQEEQVEVVDTVPVEEIIDTSVPDMSDSDEDMATYIEETVDEVIPIEEIIDTSVPDMADSDEEMAAYKEETVDEVIPIEDLIDTGSVIPEGDTLSAVDDDRKQQDVIDIIIAAGDDGEGDVSREPVEEIIEEEPVNITEDEEIQGETESKLRLDERIEQLNSQNVDEDDSEDKDIPNSLFFNNDYSR